MLRGKTSLPIPLDVFSPLNISGCLLYLDAGTPSSLWMDTAATVPATLHGDAIARWNDLSGNNRNVIQATGAKQPTLNTSILPDGRRSVLFLGSQLLSSTVLLTGTSGSIFFSFNLNTTAVLCMFSQNDEASAVRFIKFDACDSNTNRRMSITQRNNDTPDVIRGTTTLAAGARYVMGYMSNGSSYRQRLQGAEEAFTILSGANNGDWFDDTSDEDNFTVGAIKTSSELQFLNAAVRKLIVYDHLLTSGELSNLEPYLMDDIGL